MSMIINHVDGSTTVLESDADIRLYMELTGQVQTLKEPTAAELIERAMTKSRQLDKTIGGSFRVMKQIDPATAPGPETREWLKDTAVMPEEAAEPQKDVEAMLSVEVPNDLPAPAKMPRQVLPRPVAWVTELQLMVITLLRHHPEGLKTSEVATLLNWDHSKATRQTTALERRDNGLPQLVERYGKGYRYRLTSYALTASYKITTQPARMRDRVGV